MTSQLARRSAPFSPIASPVLAAWAVISDDPLAWLALFLYGILAGARLFCQHREQPARQQHGVATGTADALRSLSTAQWVILRDRLVPGDARPVHIVVGPAGVVLVTPFAGDTAADQEWRAQRHRSAERLEELLAGELGRRPAVVTPVAAGAAGWPRYGRLTMDGVQVCSVQRLTDCIGQLPATLPASGIAFVARVTDELCPAAVREGC
ncbi:hypothetical protein acdb102_18910 [Acidothermaceae bacterium B102]|nr:hypothetical protein acdb102_18910 [Acidothermaceae bacterium B102]